MCSGLSYKVTFEICRPSMSQPHGDHGEGHGGVVCKDNDLSVGKLARTKGPDQTYIAVFLCLSCDHWCSVPLTGSCRRTPFENSPEISSFIMGLNCIKPTHVLCVQPNSFSKWRCRLGYSFGCALLKRAYWFCSALALFPPFLPPSNKSAGD